MNGRVKELADEAARYSAIMFLPEGVGGDELFVSKFAGLVVEDIIKVLEEIVPFHNDYRSQIEEATKAYCIRCIINHFKDV